MRERKPTEMTITRTQLTEVYVRDNYYMYTATCPWEYKFWILVQLWFSFRDCFPLLSTLGPLQSELPRRRESLPGAGCCGGFFRSAIWCLERGSGLVQRGLAKRRFCTVPHHPTPRAVWRQRHRPRSAQLRPAGQEEESLWCLLLHVQFQRWVALLHFWKNHCTQERTCRKLPVRWWCNQIWWIKVFYCPSLVHKGSHFFKVAVL